MLLRNVFIASTIAVSTSVGCAGVTDDTATSGEAALTTLDPAQCASPTTSEGPLTDSSGQPISGSSKTTLSGCITGRSGETGAALATRVGTLVSNTALFGTVEDTPGHRLFSAFTPGQATGSLSSGLVQEVDVTLNEQYSPVTRLRFTRKKAADGSITLDIVNVTALTVNVVFQVTVVDANNLSIALTYHPQANGVSVSGACQVVMDQGGDHAAEMSGLVKAVFGWTSDQLAH
jgi:hypothetical protein